MRRVAGSTVAAAAVMVASVALSQSPATTPVKKKAGVLQAPDFLEPEPTTTEPSTTTTTTTTLPPTTASTVPERVRTRVRAVRAVRNDSRGLSGDVLDRLAQCESGGVADRHSRNGKYHGAFQFLLSTWRGIGMSGDPHTHTYEEQKEAARRLIDRSGWGQFPGCARKLGMR